MPNCWCNNCAEQHWLCPRLSGCLFLCPRLSFYANGGSTPTSVSTTSYTYDNNGIRTGVTNILTQNGVTSTTTTQYLVDSTSTTGYQQIVRSTTTDSSGNVLNTIAYTFGLQGISQTTVNYTDGQPGVATTLYFGYDGHGSVVALLNSAGAIATIAGVNQIFAYDAYGNSIGFDPSTAATVLLYSGQQFDPDVGQYYQRARVYNPATGTFDSLDSYSGDASSPLSFNKYIYGQDTPVNGVDPTGKSFLSLLGIAAHELISGLYAVAHPTDIVTYGSGFPGLGGVILPDIVNFTKGQIGEIKPFSPYGFETGYVQLGAALSVANGISVPYRGGWINVTTPIPNFRVPAGPWIPETWDPGVQFLYPGGINPIFGRQVIITVANLGGVEFYTRLTIPSSAVFAAATVYLAKDLIQQVADELRMAVQQGGRLIPGAIILGYQSRLQAAATGALLLAAGAAGTAIVNNGGLATLQSDLATAIGLNELAPIG